MKGEGREENEEEEKERNVGEAFYTCTVNNMEGSKAI